MQTIPIMLNSSSYIIRESYTYNLARNIIKVLNINDFDLNYKDELIESESNDRNRILKTTSLIEVYANEKAVEGTTSILNTTDSNSIKIIEGNSFSVSEAKYETNSFMTMRISSKNRGELEELLSLLQFRGDNNEIKYLTSSEYYYYLPKLINGVIDYFADLNNLNRDEPISSFEYLTTLKCSGLKYNVLDRLENTNIACYRKVSQIQVTIPDISELEILHNNGIYSLLLKINSIYDRAGVITLKYDNVIHNSLLDSKYLLSVNMLNGYGDGNQTSYEALLDTFNTIKLNRDELLNRYPYTYLHVPRIDNYNSYSLYGERILLSILVTIDDSNVLVNLKELGDDEIEPTLISFLSKEFNYLTENLESIFSIKLFSNDKLQPLSYLEVDNDLNVWCTKKLDKEKIHRVTLSLLNSSAPLTKRGRLAVKEHITELNGNTILINKKLISVDGALLDECKDDELSKVDRYEYKDTIREINNILRDTIVDEFIIDEFVTSYLYRGLAKVVTTDTYKYYLCNDGILRVYTLNGDVKLIKVDNGWYIPDTGVIDDKGNNIDLLGDTIFSNTVNKLDLEYERGVSETKTVQYTHIISKILRR